MTTTINNEHKELNFSSEREQSQACLNSAEHEKNQGRKVLNVPNLRFPEFQGEWEKTKFGDIATGFDYGMNAAAKNYDGVNKYIRITDIDEASSTYTDKDIVSPDGILTDNYLVNNRDILLARTGASTGKSYLYKQSDGKLYYAGFLIRANVTTHDPYFVFSQLHTHRYWRWVSIMSARSGQPGINSQEYSSFPIYTTSIEEESKIAKLLSLLDERIATQSKIIDKLQSLIKGIRNDVYGKLRKSVGFNAMISDVLSYEQPQPYIVENTEYTAEGIPVLTANKAFVLGYTSETNGIYDKGDCIIFDDFTLDCKYVDFPYKIKSSAIKILTAKNKELLRYTFEFLKYLDLSTEEHKRHYIAEIQNQEFILPTMHIVSTIAHAFSALSLRMESVVKQRNMFETQKQYLLRQMFI